MPPRCCFFVEVGLLTLSRAANGIEYHFVFRPLGLDKSSGSVSVRLGKGGREER